MNFQDFKTDEKCLRSQLAAYVEGELSSREELELEMHLAVCKSCAAELNEQKKLLCALDCALEVEQEIALPVNFTEVVVARAQSKVSGLRAPRERFKALFVCLALFLLVVLGLGGKIEAILNTYIKFGEQLLAVGAFALHLIYDISIGTAVIARSLSNQFVNNLPFAGTFFVAFFFFSLFAAARLFTRYNRA